MERLKNLLFDIKLWPQSMLPITLHCDSQASMSLALRQVCNDKSRHISLRHDYAKELIKEGLITIIYYICEIMW